MKITPLIKQFHKNEFKFKDLESYYIQRKSIFGDMDLKQVFVQLFKFSIIGNKSGGERPYYSWAYREDNANIDFDNDMVVHFGIRKAMNLW